MDLEKRIFTIDSEETFLRTCLEVFRYQAEACPIYKHYIALRRIDPSGVTRLDEIPFLPIEFFKTHSIIAEGKSAAITFSSSGTTGTTQSKHLVADIGLYEESFLRAFQAFYGDPRDLAILALLPSYLEREGSSLIYMVDHLIQRSQVPQSGYFLYNYDDLLATLSELRARRTPTLLMGVTYALLDFAESHALDFPELTVMETGGMKGRRREMVREEVHNLLTRRFGVGQIHSEYGMTELLSQAYSAGAGRFRCPPWLRVIAREANDPFSLETSGKTGALNIVDLANLYSCAFIETQDLGKVYPDGSFEVLGRFDNSDIRGCNLLVQ